MSKTTTKLWALTAASKKAGLDESTLGKRVDRMRMAMPTGRYVTLDRNNDGFKEEIAITDEELKAIIKEERAKKKEKR